MSLDIGIKTKREIYKIGGKKEMETITKEDKEKTKEYNKQYYEKHKDKLKEYRKQYREQHRAKFQEYNKKYYDAHKDELLLKHKIWRANNKEKVRAAVKKYHQLHPEVSKAAINKFRAKVNWAEYCGQKRKERVERLKAQGVINPWKVVAKKEEPKYKDNK